MRLNKGLMLSFILLLGCMLAGTNSQAADMKIAVMNVQKVLVSCSAGKAAKGRLDSRAKELQSSFKQEEEALKGLQAEIKKKSTAWSEEKKAEKIREYQKDGRELQAKTEDARYEMKQLQDKELEPILKTLDKVVQDYGKSHGYTVILDTKMGVLYSDNAIDVSDEIVKKLDQAMAGK